VGGVWGGGSVGGWVCVCVCVCLCVSGHGSLIGHGSLRTWPCFCHMSSKLQVIRTCSFVCRGFGCPSGLNCDCTYRMDVVDGVLVFKHAMHLCPVPGPETSPSGFPSFWWMDIQVYAAQSCCVSWRCGPAGATQRRMKLQTCTESRVPDPERAFELLVDGYSSLRSQSYHVT